jgi:4-hydroxybenzoate polyprenyl transferase
MPTSTARSRAPPAAGGERRVSARAAWTWLLALCGVGLVVLVQLRLEAQLVALGSLALVAAYPFMKRITWWPQAWLGLVFTWGAPVGWIAMRSDRLDVLAALYAGSIFWCIGYDTIYALQDREDDALVGIRSSALRLGDNVQAGVVAFYCLALGLWGTGVLAVARGLGGAAGAAACSGSPAVAGLHARPGGPRQPSRTLPVEPLHRTAGGVGVPGSGNA